MIILLGDTAEQQTAKYAAILASIGNDPSRFGELTDEDAAWCVSWLHSQLLILTRAMQSRASQAECEAAVSQWFNAAPGALDRQASLAMRRLQRGLPQTLRDMSALWVTGCAIKEQIAGELERRHSAMN